MGRGKLIGLLIGLVLALLSRRPWVLVAGLVVGHLADTGFFQSRPEARTPEPPAPAEDPYAALGITSSASDEEVEQAYRRRMSEYHPDRVANAAQEIQDLAGRRAREANAAFEAIQRQRGR